jgi:hypothetical protein
LARKYLARKYLARKYLARKYLARKYPLRFSANLSNMEKLCGRLRRRHGVA